MDSKVPIPTRYKRVHSQPENPFATLIPEQSIAVIPSFTLESGTILENVPVAYTTRGRLSATGDNAMVICHALTGSANVGDWWGPLLGGPGRAFDISRFFVVCMNSLGSPYGTASPVTHKDGDKRKGRYGPEFPLTTIRDDVKLHKLLLDDLGVVQIAVVVGGSMGGMLTLEWAYFGKDYVRSIIPIATSSQHSAWGISWGEAQRQSIYCDPKYEDGYYSFEDPPLAGLGAARMSALLTYRSRDSFESRFGRSIPGKDPTNNAPRPLTPTESHWAVHNDGHKNAKSARLAPVSNGYGPKGTNGALQSHVELAYTDPQFSQARVSASRAEASNISTQSKNTSTYFSAQSYLRYQGDKFVKRFDANCYIAITRKLDTHDVSRHRVDSQSPNRIAEALSFIEQPTLVIGIESDGLFTYSEQEELAAGIPNAKLRKIDSPEGHDAFLLQFEQVNTHILAFLKDALPAIMERPVTPADPGKQDANKAPKHSMIGEAEMDDLTVW
ncbi:MAG: homoserine O- acetyltransferase [Trizodia sp. TS-e1964]|nr:MAG: homoserine O- acetyltransferase [Trizodia sp. TS-e1964]